METFINEFVIFIILLFILIVISNDWFRILYNYIKSTVSKYYTKKTIENMTDGANIKETVTARYVICESHQYNQYFQIAQLEVYDKFNTNIALNKPVIISSLYDSPYPASKITDGKPIEGFWHSKNTANKSTKTSTNGNYAWACIYLGEPMEIRKIIFYGRIGHSKTGSAKHYYSRTAPHSIYLTNSFTNNKQPNDISKITKFVSSNANERDLGQGYTKQTMITYDILELLKLQNSDILYSDSEGNKVNTNDDYVLWNTSTNSVIEHVNASSGKYWSSGKNGGNLQMSNKDTNGNKYSSYLSIKNVPDNQKFKITQNINPTDGNVTYTLWDKDKIHYVSFDDKKRIRIFPYPELKGVIPSNWTWEKMDLKDNGDNTITISSNPYKTVLVSNPDKKRVMYTTDGRKCIDRFYYAGWKNGCITFDEPKYWCSTRVHSNGHHVFGNWNWCGTATAQGLELKSENTSYNGERFYFINISELEKRNKEEEDTQQSIQDDINLLINQRDSQNNVMRNQENIDHLQIQINELENQKKLNKNSIVKQGEIAEKQRSINSFHKDINELIDKIS